MTTWEEARASQEGAAIRKLEGQLGILQIQYKSHGTDLREMSHQVETIILQQEEMRQTNEELGRTLMKLIEKLESSGEGASGIPNSGLSEANPTGWSFGTLGKNGGTGSGLPSGVGRGEPKPINVGLGFNHGGGFVYEGGRAGRFEYTHRKIDMPQFSGSDPDGWIL
ncbi:hypothetical protein LXL04_038990 [Taraxacum kok-saghyz]